MLYPSPELPADQVNALRLINVVISGGIHGQNTRIEPYGPACLGVIDGDYQGTGSIVNKLSADRGDVSAFEDQWHNPDEDNAWFLRNMQEVANESTLIDVDPFDLSIFAIQARRGMVVSPHDYAQCLTISKGIRTEFVDATEDERDAWLSQRRQAGYTYPPGLFESATFRDIKIVERLGAIAATMDLGRRWHRPTLAMTVGDDHTAGIKRHLKANGVRAKTHRYSPNLNKRTAADLQYIGSSQTLPHKQQWLENAQKVAAS